MTHNTTPLVKNQPTNSARLETEEMIRDFPAEAHNTEIAFPLDPSPISYSTAPISSFFTAKAEEKEGRRGGAANPRKRWWWLLVSLWRARPLLLRH
jgi:hypothetical protein